MMFDVRCEWGSDGAAALDDCRTFIVVDVLSFSTCVSIANARQAVVYPCGLGDASSAKLAERHEAVLAGPRGHMYSLSPASLLKLPAGTRLVLPSPNGAILSLEASARGDVLAGCLRNASAVCARARALGGPFGILAAGERWSGGTPRFAVEDLIGAGAIAAMLPGSRSPEASAAIAAFQSSAPQLSDTLLSSVSGRELAARGFARDVQLAAELDADTVAPELRDGGFRSLA